MYKIKRFNFEKISFTIIQLLQYNNKKIYKDFYINTKL